ncbi:UbiA family prenyltransferase [Streptomyces luteireticuli]|uniref:Prenyltransferase n=1 Tax=Streptomyces luteireticuli TaxID=173858 RepID=A0ABP3IQ25_9ACTN
MTLVLQQAKALYGLSRGTQATLSIAQPVIAMLLADDHPAPARLALATAAVLAGFFAVFAVNDLLDAPLDRLRRTRTGPAQGFDLERAGLHPLADGKLPYAAGVVWAVALGAVAVAAFATLGRACVALFLAGAALEVVYCLLARVTPYKFLVSGALVTLGACIGWFAFSGDPDPVRLGLFALWMAAWEMGGRNIPNDLADADEDAELGITTLPTVHGPRRSAQTAFACLVVASAAGIALAVAARPSFGPLGVLGAALSAVFLLLVPGVALLRRPSAATALGLFNRASFQPPCVLAACALALLLR